MADRLTQTARAELCRRADLAAIMSADGVELKRAGPGQWVCALRDERTPSCYVYGPDVGRYRARGWTYYDYGAGQGGDALGYLVDVRGMDYLDAARMLADAGGWWPDCLTPEHNDTPRRAARPPAPVPARPPAPPVLDARTQAHAVGTYLRTLYDMRPDCVSAGGAYVAGRGCMPPDGAPCAALLRAGDCAPLLDALQPHADLMARAGLIKPPGDGKPMRLPWWDDTALIWAAGPDGRPLYLVGRRLHHKPGGVGGKYVNQLTRAGAVRYPVGLPSLYAARGRDLLLVEGPLDALGAVRMGWAALALLTRPQARDYTDTHGAAVRMLSPHLPALLDCRRVYVMPDADGGDAGAKGAAMGARLVGWLRAGGVSADLATLRDIFPDAPPESKDVADIAAALPPDSVPPPPPESGRDDYGLAPDIAATVRRVCAALDGQLEAIKHG